MDTQHLPRVHFTEMEYKGQKCLKDEYGNIYDLSLKYIEKEENERKRQKKKKEEPMNSE